MQNKTIGAILIFGALLYFLFTSFVVGHGIHPLNTLGAIIALTLGIVIFFREEAAETTPSSRPITESREQPESTLPPTQKVKIFFVSLAFGLFTAIIIALTYLATSAGETLTTILSFAGGVSNIVLPCTLPLVFIIVPLSMGKGYKKGLIMALLFGLGLTLRRCYCFSGKISWFGSSNADTLYRRRYRRLNFRFSNTCAY